MPYAPKQHSRNGISATPTEKHWESRRSGRHDLYNHPIWRHPTTGIRVLVLQRDNFLCQECMRNGIIKAVKQHTTRDDVEHQGHADHIEDHNGYWDRFIDMSNIETKCGTCHNRKTASKDGSAGGVLSDAGGGQNVGTGRR